MVMTLKKNCHYLQFFTVKVAGGSGCLFQPLDSEYSYVLTAKHVIEGVENIEIVRQYIGNDGNKVDEILKILEIPYMHSNPNKDAAIGCPNKNSIVRKGIKLILT